MPVDRVRLAELTIVIALVLAACGGGGDDVAEEPRPGERERAATEAEPPSSTTTAPGEAADPVEEAILSGYRAGWEAFEQAMDPPNPDHPALAATSTGRALAQTRKYLAEIRARSNTLRGAMTLDPGLRERSADRAVIWDCVEDSATEVPVGSTEQAGTPELLGWEVHMELVDGTWMQEVLYPTAEACAGR